MGNLAACAGARSEYPVAGGKRRHPSRRSESMPAKPLTAVFGRVRSLRRRRQEQQSVDEVGAGDGDVHIECPASDTAENNVPVTADCPRDPVLEQLMQLKARLHNGNLEQSSTPQPAGSSEPPQSAASQEEAQRRNGGRPPAKFNRCLSYAAPPSRKKLLETTPTPTVTADSAAEGFDTEVVGIMEQAAPPSNSPPPKPPKREVTRPSRSAPSTPPLLRGSSGVALSGAGARTPPPKPPRHSNHHQQPPQRPPPRSPLPAAIESSLMTMASAERRARPNTPDSLDGGKCDTGNSDDGEQQLQLNQPKLRKKQMRKETARPTSKSVFNLADPKLIMDTSAYENVDWDGHLAALRPTCFGSAMCHMDHLEQANSGEILHSTAVELGNSSADNGQLTLPLTSRSRAARQILSRAFVQCLPIGGADFLRLCRARGCLSELASRELLRTTADSAGSNAPDGPTNRAERFVELFDWSETSLRKLAQCLTATGGARRPFYSQLAAILNFLADLFALLAAKHLFAQPDSRAGKRRRVDAFLRGVRLIDGDSGREEDQQLRCQIQLLYLGNSDEPSIEQDANFITDNGHHGVRHQLSARELAAINEPDWLCTNFTPSLSLDLTGSGVNAWFFKQLVGKSLEPVSELSLAGCDLDSGLLPTLVLTQRTSRLRVLCLAGAALGDESLSALCLLPQHQLASLQVLDLSACGVTHFGLSLLAGCLSVTLPRLSDLDLSWNDLSDAAPATVAGLLDPAAGLRGLRLRGCRLASDALRAIVDGLAVAAAESLRVLDLSDNRLNCLILTRLAERLGRGANGGGRLSELGLAGVNLFASDLQQLLDSGGCDGCRRLDLGRNHLGEAGAVALAARLPPRLECLAVNSCRLGCRGLRRLLEAAKFANRLRMVRAANNLRNRRRGGTGGMGAEEATLRREISEAGFATGGRLRFLVDGDAAAVAATAKEDGRFEQARQLARGTAPGGGDGSLRRSLRRLASLD